MNRLGLTGVMDKEIRDEFEKVHGRVSDLKQRVTVLETDLPHIRRGVDRIEGQISWASRIVVGAILLSIVTFALRGGFTPL